MRLKLPLLAILLLSSLALAQQPAITVHVDKPGIKISPTLYGIFFEEINRAGDGGLYAEMIQNRSFEDDKKSPKAWSLVRSDGSDGQFCLDSTQPLNSKNPHALKLQITKPGSRFGVTNEGFHGIAVKTGTQYNLTLYARSSDFASPLTITLESADGQSTYASAKIESLTSDWKQHCAVLTSTATDPAARLVISADKPGTIYLDMVSLFPKDTFKNHPFRADLAQFLADMHPAFVRFPGGCYVEGDKLANAFRWKNTIGDIAQRPGHWNLWGYYSNDGLGYHEYLQLCEDIGAEPLFVVNCGMAHGDHVPMNKMDEYVQDALDAIEYANGPVDSKWGALRAKAGHPAPFNLKFIEIGNENGGKLYNERYPLFHDAIKARYPGIQLVANNWGGVPANRTLDITDEHYYASPEFFISEFRKYDSYPRTGPKIYVGEYAVTQGCGHGNLRGALGEAVFMCGMERNSDKVTLASYAPLFVNTHWRQWNPDAIVFNAAQSYGIPSYYVQAMFASNRADVNLPLDAISPPMKVETPQGMIGVGTWLTQAEYKDIKVTQGDKVLFASDFSSSANGWKLETGQWTTHDNALRQSSKDENCRATIGDKTWSDYTLTLRARKISGDEGFLILFRHDGSGEKSWWNIGGWGNSRHALEVPGITNASAPGKIETGRWYDIRIELAGQRIRCFLDNKLIHDVSSSSFHSLYGVAGRNTSTNEIILKVVNVSAEPQTTHLTLAGLKSLAKSATALTLTSEKGSDENSFEFPTKISPKPSTLTLDGSPSFIHTFPPNSVTILRLKPE